MLPAASKMSIAALVVASAALTFVSRARKSAQIPPRIAVCLRHFAAVSLIASLGCETPPPTDSPGVAAASFELLFDSAAAVRLIESDTAPLARVSSLSFAEDGSLVVADGYSGKVRMYDAEGHLIRSLGRPGRGPGEFEQLTAATALPSGSVCGVDARSSRVTCFAGDDSTFTLAFPGTSGLSISAVGDSLVVAMGAGPSEPQVALLSTRNRPPTSFFSRPASYDTVPYWGSLHSVLIAPIRNALYVANGLFYPVRIFDWNGDSIGVIAQPPDEWNPPAVVERGRFAGPAARLDLARWLRGSSVIARLLVVDDSRLVIVRGEYRPDVNRSPAEFFQVYPTTIDVYGLSGQRIAGAVDPPGTPLYADSLLYVLQGTPPDPWTVVGYRLKQGI